MGGKSGGSDKMYKLQQQQAEEARKKEEERKARIDKGLVGIKEAFEGGPIMATRQVAAPSTTTSVPTQTQQKVWVKNVGSGGGRGTGGSNAGGHWETKVVPGTKQVVKPGVGTVAEQYDTGERSGGFNDEFYNKFRQGITDYYMPQVAQKYGEAKDETTYGLARAGTLRSTAAIDEAAKLAEQNRPNRAEVLAQADTGAADIRTRVAAERAKAEQQLYATENPDVATNQALAAVNNIQLDKPDLSPLGEIFKIATIGGANALSGYRNQQFQNRLPAEYRSGGGWGASKTYGS
jgi:hypothetical protein